MSPPADDAGMLKHHHFLTLATTGTSVLVDGTMMACPPLADDELSSGSVPDADVHALSFTAAQCFLPFGGKPKRRRRKKRRKRRTQTEKRTNTLPVC